MDIVDWASGLLTKLEALENDHLLSFTQESFPALPDVQLTTNLILRPGGTNVDGVQIDGVHCSLDKRTAGALGCVLLKSIFDSVDTSIELQAPMNEVTHVIIEASRHAYFFGLPNANLKLMSLEFCASDDIGKHPWRFPVLASPHDYPRFTYQENYTSDPSEVTKARSKSLLISSSMAGDIRFAELLLNLGRPQCLEDEIALEGEWGFRGVAPASLDLTLWLPGSLGY